MDECSKKLIIWDFDGVMADTEKLWLENRRQMINEKFGLNWDFDTTNKHLGGMSDKTKRLNMDKLGLTTDDEFWKESMARDMAVMAKGFEATPGTEDILNCREIKQCVATGGIYSKSVEKLKTIGFWGKYINDTNLFTADMVEHGKPEPELFLRQLPRTTRSTRPRRPVRLSSTSARRSRSLSTRLPSGCSSRTMSMSS